MDNVRIADSEPIVEEQAGINTELLLKVAEAVEKQSDRFDMRRWRGVRQKDLPNPWYRRIFGIPAKQEACGTTLCVAGWAVQLGGGDMKGNIPAQAQKLLRLNMHQAKKLFYAQHWPVEYRQYNDQKYHLENGWMAADRIRHFIATDGRE